MAHKKDDGKKEHESKKHGGKIGHAVHELVKGHAPQHDKKEVKGSHHPKEKHPKAK